MKLQYGILVFISIFSLGQFNSIFDVGIGNWNKCFSRKVTTCNFLVACPTKAEPVCAFNGCKYRVFHNSCTLGVYNCEYKPNYVAQGSFEPCSECYIGVRNEALSLAAQNGTTTARKANATTQVTKEKS